jgi:hypothetical protein
MFYEYVMINVYYFLIFTVITDVFHVFTGKVVEKYRKEMYLLTEK